ncbi:MAG TPA: D-alanine--D-alanine ligase family protein [Pseudonocardiaceae bacterium]|jgi:D-alanine-D-alanine ligase|nr:D-alanine--D-alanine ligase family protein [Pseudonocardiaceae bacterium]
MTEGKLRVAVVFGGRSTEHGVSCLSAGSVLANLDPDRFEPVSIGITKAGAWVIGPDDPAALCARGRELPAVEAADSADSDSASTDLAVTAPSAVASAGPGDLINGVDVVFPVLHGAFGEDGTIQGLLELADIPYVGPGVLASAAAMDKEITKKLLAAVGLPVGDYVVLRRGVATLAQADRDRLGLPVFVKPARAGSSTGITRVTDWADLAGAIATAREIDPKVIIEAAVVGQEIECGVLEFPDGRIEASLPAEIRIIATDVDFYDFDTKYLDDACEFDIPAKLDDEVIVRLRAAAVEAFTALDCQGLARVDFFVRPDGALVINEINTMPGFTAISMFPKMWAVTGIDYQTLLTTMIDTAIARGTGLR